MYNRYSMEIRDDDYAPVSAAAVAGARPVPPAPGPAFPPHAGPPPHPGHGQPPLHTGGAPGGGLPALSVQLSKLLGNFHIPQLELDDLLLFGIAWLILRESEDTELLLILAALFFFGLGDR